MASPRCRRTTYVVLCTSARH